ncbi:MAG: M1 family metallopeptidase [Flavobacteriales bacterium]|jgi:aminopeptidase N|nr:M1 family metallopeptidase [Flavobacteriales bacterium]
MKNYLILLSLAGICSFHSCKSSKEAQKTTDIDHENMAVSDSVVNFDELTLEENVISEVKKHQESAKKVIDILHTQLHIDLDWEQKIIHGIAHLSLKPFRGELNAFNLHAKGLKVKKVYFTANKEKLKFETNGDLLHIQLPRYVSSQTKISIEYQAQPSESARLQANKLGLYFKTNHREYPNHIWTQGEVQQSSCWYPTVDEPNEKMTQEIFLTIPNQYTSLSNGAYLGTEYLSNGKKIEHWKLSQPHSPYLSMLFAGDFSLIKGKPWNGKDISYYVEPQYQHRTEEFFGRTQEMLTHFSNLLGTPYPWDKLGQVITRDFTAGGMENTGAIVYYDAMYSDEKHRLGSDFDDLVAHEIFHQWFGNLVTCEAWSQLSLNESFATYGEFLWLEHKKGEQEADYHLHQDLEHYLQEALSKREAIINAEYEKPEDLFDRHRYAKGGRVLHMLRTYLGDDIFFEALQLYLERYAYKNTEIAHLRLCFEEISGEDLKWFFHQWFHQKGHPEIEVEHEFVNRTLTVKVKQTQSLDTYPLYRLPLKIDLYHANGITRKDIVMTKDYQEFVFMMDEKPLLVDFDGEKALLAEIDQTKTAEEYSFQYRKTFNFLAKAEALEGVFRVKPKDINQLTNKALSEFFWYFRKYALENMDVINPEDREQFYIKIIDMARQDKHPKVKIAALKCLEKNFSTRYTTEIFQNALKDPNYQVRKVALKYYYKQQPKEAHALAMQWDKMLDPVLNKAVAYVYAQQINPSYMDYFQEKIKKYPLDYEYYSAYQAYLLKMKKGYIAEGVRFLGNCKADGIQNQEYFIAYTLKGIKESLKSKDEIHYQDIIKEIDFILE